MPLPCIAHGLIITCNLCGPIDCGHFQLHMHLLLLGSFWELSHRLSIVNCKDCHFKFHEPHKTLKKLKWRYSFFVKCHIGPLNCDTYWVHEGIATEHTFKKIILSIPSLYLAIYHSRHVFDKKYNGYIRPTYLGWSFNLWGLALGYATLILLTGGNDINLQTCIPVVCDQRAFCVLLLILFG